MTDPFPQKIGLRTVLRTPALSGPDAGWFRPLAAVVLGVFVPSYAALAVVAWGDMGFSGPPKDGTGYKVEDHIAAVFGLLSVSFVVSWMFIPLVLLVLRAAVMLGWAGWGIAMTAAIILGVPAAHFALNGDITTENTTFLPHLVFAIALLGLSVWAFYWGLTAWKYKRSRNKGS